MGHSLLASKEMLIINLISLLYTINCVRDLYRTAIPLDDSCCPKPLAQSKTPLRLIFCIGFKFQPSIALRQGKLWHQNSRQPPTKSSDTLANQVPPRTSIAQLISEISKTRNFFFYEEKKELPRDSLVLWPPTRLCPQILLTSS